jgi:methylated-DNA-protein-cysteine methyltransferase-like protein
VAPKAPVPQARAGLRRSFAGFFTLAFSFDIEYIGIARLMKRSNTFFRRVVTLIKKIPHGKVATYGQVAALAGNPRSARQIAWVLHTFSEKKNLPWHRVINREGTISLPRYGGYELQRALLIEEGVEFDAHDRIDLARFQWRPQKRRGAKAKSGSE